MSDMKMYNILGKFNNLDPKMTAVKEDVKTELVYENVEPRGSIMEAVKNLEEKYQGFKKTVAAIKKGGSAEDPEAVAAAIGRKKYGKAKFQKAAAAGKKLGEEAKPDFLDLDDDGDTDEPMKDAAKDAEPAKTDKSAVEKRKRLQALKDKQEDERAERSDDHKSHVRTVKGKAYGGAAQKDDEEKDLDESGLQAYLGKKKYGKEGMKALQKAGREGASKEKMAQIRAKHDKMDEVAPPGAKAERMVKHIKKGYAKDGKLTKKEKGIAYATAWKAHNKGQVEEGVKFSDTIKNSEAKMTKAKPAMVKESRVMEETDYFYEKIGKALAEKNPTLDTASSEFNTAVRQEMIAHGIEPNRARNIIKMDDDFISDVATSYSHCCQEIAECGSPMNSFVEESPMKELDEIARLAGLPVKETEVYDTVNHEEVEDNMDETALGAVAGGVAGAALGKTPAAAGMGAQIGDQLTGESTDDERKLERYHELIKQGMDPDDAEVQVFNDEGDEDDLMGEGNAFTAKLLATKKGDKFELDGKEYTDNSDLGESALEEEEEMGEGNEFSGALAKARASGAKEFEVDGKKYTVKEDVNLNVSATGEEDVVNLVRKLAGMPVIAVAAQEAQPVIDMTGEALEEDGPVERDIEYTNTPREEVAGVDAAIPAGADLNRAKKQYKKEYPGDNPMAVKEEALWKSYEAMINDVKG